MASPTLGKRTRSSTDTDLKLSVKRQARQELFNDENECPFLSTKSPVHIEIDELSEHLSITSTPSKRGRNSRRQPLSPSKTNLISIENNDTNNEPENVLQTLTPQTPRHRDAPCKPVPITPRHRVLVRTNSLTPRTPRTSASPSQPPTVYGQARQLFTRSKDAGKLVGRDEERQELTKFIQDRVTGNTGGCIYVSGPPGTGKSAMIDEVSSAFEASQTLKKAYVNCMSIKTSKDLYATLLEFLCGETEVMEGDEIRTLQHMFVPTRKSSTTYLITLDEIDHILTLDLEMMYKLIEWSLQKSSRLILIGISNALDLTDRYLPRLKARNLKPELLPFLPYSASQIKTIIITRLKSLMPVDSATPDYVPFLHPAAIELCSRTVSRQTGDLRKAFDICRRALDLVESETRKQHEQESFAKRPLEENPNLSSPGTPSKRLKACTQSLAALTVETAPRASIQHVKTITSSTFGNGATQRLKTLNLQQKAALCALVALEKRKREAAANVTITPSKSAAVAPTIKVLYSTYCMLCTRDAVLHPLTSTEFRDVIGSLETLSLVSQIDGRNGSFVALTPSKRGRKPGFNSTIGIGDERRIGSCVSEKEVAQAVEGLGAGILKSILSGEGLD
ncbi:P-loop containing nucleoside triphosphate hydrolase protein [Xylogone sp. PMI_703]|nr:P-loop containing nucleoside triphosphate hydrolase protein [Xylogone sp. PMI_703]